MTEIDLIYLLKTTRMKAFAIKKNKLTVYMVYITLSSEITTVRLRADNSYNIDLKVRV